MHTTYHQPVVVLEHSSSVKSVHCTRNGIDIVFNSLTACTHAQLYWVLEKGLVFSTHTAGCGDGQRDYWRASKVDFDRRSFTAHVKAVRITIHDIVDEVDLIWGTYKPDTYGPPSGGNGGGGNGGYGSSTKSSTASYPSATGGVCARPPSKVLGFPTAPCGPNFDSELDAKLPHYNFNGEFSKSLRELAPGLASYDEMNYGNDDIIGENYPNQDKRSVDLVARNRLQRRWGWPPIIQRGARAISNAGRAIGNTVKSVANTAVNTATAVGNFVGDVVTGEFGPSIDSAVPINAGPTSNLQDSPWGRQYRLFLREGQSKSGVQGKLELFCVDCGLRGNAHFKGQLKFSLPQARLTQGFITVTGNLAATLKLGLAAQIEFEPEPLRQKIFAQGLPHFTIPGVIILGPEVALDAELGFKLSASGQVLAGATLSFPNFRATLDVVNQGGSQVTGFTPTFTPTFEAQGEIAATAKLGLPLSLGVGFNIIPLGQTGRRLIAIVNTPAVEVSAKFSSGGGSSCNNGVQIEVGVTHNTAIDFFGLANRGLYEYKSPSFLDRCIPIRRSARRSERRSLPAPSDLNTRDLAKRATHTDFDGLSPPARAPNDTSWQEQVAVANQVIDAGIAANGAGNLDGFVYNTIHSRYGDWYLKSDNSGGLHLATGSATPETVENIMWASYEGIAMMDEQERVPYYYPEMMDKLGVSRFRVGYADQIPKGAKLLGLVTLNTDNKDSTPGIYFALSTRGFFYYPVACNIAGQTTKLFLVKDPAKGPRRLEKSDLRNIVTGGVTSNCKFMPFMSRDKGMF